MKNSKVLAVNFWSQKTGFFYLETFLESSSLDI
jgi:hypothetical protein